MINHKMSGINKETLEDQFTVIRRQEADVYRCSDYLAPEYQPKQLGGHDLMSVLESLPSDASAGSLSDVWREKICEWCYQVVDHFDFCREVVDVSMSFLDRYLSTRRVNKKIFQLAAMTCLYLAIKLYEPTSLKISSLIGLSRGFFTADHIVAMEQSILRALEWRVNPPTVMSAIRYYAAMIDKNVDAKAKTDITELSRFLSELSVCDYFFVTRNPTSIALACVLTAFEGVPHDILPRTQRQKFVNEVYRITKINCTVDEVHDCRLRLRDVYQRGNYHKPKEVGTGTSRRSGGQSPDNVVRHVEVNNAHMGDSRAPHNANTQPFNHEPIQMQSAFINSEPMDQDNNLL